MKIQSKLLRNWDSLWRYPILLTQLVSIKDDMDLPAIDVAREVVNGIAQPFTLPDSFNYLLNNGEFLAATFLLEKLNKDKVLPESDSKALRGRFEKAKARAIAEISVRKFELTTRAIRAGLEDKPLASSILDVSRSAADAVLDQWEIEIYSKEVQLQNILRERFEHARHNISMSDPYKEVWEKSLAASIEMCRFRVAEELLNAGPKPLIGKTLEPIEVPRRPIWPYTVSMKHSFRMLTSGDNEIRRTWAPSPENKVTLQLLDTIKPLILTDGDVTRDEISDFVTSLDIWLGTPQREHRVISSDTGYTSMLYGLSEPRVPRLAMCVDGVPIWFPRKSAREIPLHVSDSPALIAFYLDREPTNTRKALAFTPILLFRLANDRYPRINFIRWLARQIETENMMPANLDLHLLPKNDDEIRRYVAWLFDFHGVPVTSESVLELVVFYSASNAYILRALIIAIGSEIEDRHNGVKVEHVHKAWNNPKFRDSAIAYCLEPIAGDSWLLSILACAYFISEAGEQITSQDILDWLSVFGYKGDQDVSAALQVLISHNLLGVGEIPSSATIKRSALSLLVREHVVDLEQFVTTQLKL